jgi:hypothetical protein
MTARFHNLEDRNLNNHCRDNFETYIKEMVLNNLQGGCDGQGIKLPMEKMRNEYRIWICWKPEISIEVREIDYIPFPRHTIAITTGQALLYVRIITSLMRSNNESMAVTGDICSQ